MNADWTPLRETLSACRRDGIALPIWWRDDDAVSATPALDRLSSLSTDLGLPVHLAIIPAHLDETLVDFIATAPLIPVVHGWAHTDHSAGIGKKNEFLTPRNDASNETAEALKRMRGHFGPALLPMFVPPWNWINSLFVQAFPSQGYCMLSTYGARTSPEATPGLALIYTNIDPIWWKGTRFLVDPAHLIAQACQHL